MIGENREFVQSEDISVSTGDALLDPLIINFSGTDAEYNKIYTQTKDENGNDYFRELKEIGVRAIYIHDVETSFDLKDNDGTTKGQIKRTGIYLSESSSAGTVQQINVAVQFKVNTVKKFWEEEY